MAAAAVQYPSFFHLLLFSLYLVPTSYALMSESEILVKFKSSLSHSDEAGGLGKWGKDINLPPCKGGGGVSNWGDSVVCEGGIVTGLILENMGLSGTIDVDTLKALPNLRILSFINNKFEGPIPELKKLNRLKNIFLSKNGFSGEIPGDAFSGMIGLKKVHLSSNKFTGPIPSSLAALPKLMDLKLDGNQFSGHIPDFQQKSLGKFDVSNNALEGPIPVGLISNKNPDFLFSGNKGLCGEASNPCSNSTDTSTSTGTGTGTSTSSSKFKKPSSSFISMVILAFGVFVLVGVLGVMMLIVRRGRKQPALSVEAPPSNLGIKAGMKEEELYSSSSTHSRNGKKAEAAATKLSFVRDDRESFDLSDLLKASAEILGSGSFGSSYKTALPSGAEMVVKRYKQMNNVGKEEFQEHMRRIGRLNHHNLLPLVAYYYRKEEKLIVADFVQRGSLAVHLHGYQSLGQPALDWPTRLKIVKGVAKGLGYLYKELPSLIAPHGHLKSSNILLNESLEPLITDYALIPVINQESAQDLMVAYKSPEYAQHGRITKKTDIWALGVLILEVLTGKFPANFLHKGKASEDQDLATWVKSVAGDDMSGADQVFDKDMGARNNNGEGEMLKLLNIALSCCEVDVDKRLDIKLAVDQIEGLNEGDHDHEDFYSSVASDAGDKRSSRGMSDDFSL